MGIGQLGHWFMLTFAAYHMRPVTPVGLFDYLHFHWIVRYGYSDQTVYVHAGSG